MTDETSRPAEAATPATPIPRSRGRGARRAEPAPSAERVALRPEGKRLFVGMRVSLATGKRARQGGG